MRLTGAVLLSVLSIFPLPFRGKSASIKGQNAPIVVGWWFSVYTLPVLVTPGGYFYFAQLHAFYLILHAVQFFIAIQSQQYGHGLIPLAIAVLVSYAKNVDL